MDKSSGVAAIILAAGLSQRMGQPKLLLPWGNSTVIEQVTGVLSDCDVRPIVIVSGKTDSELQRLFRYSENHVAFNTEFENGSMITSLQVGLKTVEDLGATAALMALGDQPQIQIETVKRVIRAHHSDPDRLIIPSYQMRRGHPWIIPQRFWQELCNLDPEQTMRSFLNGHEKDIIYTVVDTASIHADLDTPEDYLREKPPASD
jgi:molybdenum cofactor cytidylyltransferase